MAGKKLLEKLAPRHRMAAGLKLRGWKHKQIAEELGTTEQVVSNWMHDPMVKAEMEHQAKDFLGQLDTAVVGGILQSVETGTARVMAPGMVSHNGETVVVPLDEVPVSESDRRAWAFRLFDMLPATRDPRHVPEGQGEVSRGLPDPTGDGGTTNVMTIIGGMTPQQLEAAQDKALKQLTDIEGNGKPK